MQVQARAAKQVGASLEPYNFEVESPQGHQCLIRVEYCGICHSDIHAIDDDWGMSKYPLIPGHEVIGIVEAISPQVNHLKVGDRVGVGWQRSSCLQCSDCLHGKENLCDRTEALIFTGPGGFANYLLSDSRFTFLIPENIKPQVAGPLLCGGITVYSGLRSAGMTSGQEIGIIGVGGLGHLAVKFAKSLGNRVTVFTTSEDKAEFAHHLGADRAIVVPKGEAPPKSDEGLDIILSTVPASLDWPAYLEYLNSDGTLCLVGVTDAPLNLPIWALLGKRRRVMASPIGGRGMMMDLLSIASRYQIEPMVEVFSFEEVNQAISRVKSNQVRYRAVLQIG